MKKLPLFLVALLTFGGFGLATASAQREVIVENNRPVRYSVRRAYVIENHRPVRREVFVDEGGRYFRVVKGRRVFIDRHYDEYPTQYFTRDGRVRPGIRITF